MLNNFRIDAVCYQECTVYVRNGSLDQPAKEAICKVADASPYFIAWVFWRKVLRPYY